MGRCRVPTADGLCGHLSYTQSEADYHAAKCAREHHDEIVAAIRSKRPEGLQAWDPEHAAWQKAHADELLRGRLKA